MKNIDFEKAGKKIKEKRTQKGISQSKLAEDIGISAQALSNIENGKNEDGGAVRHFINIAVALELSLDDLFEIEEIKQATSITTQRYLDTIKYFIELIAPAFYNRKYAESPATLEINDIGVNYYIQEYFARRAIFNEISTENFDMIQKAKELVLDDLDRQIEEKMDISNNSLTFKPGNNSHFEYDSNTGKIIIEPFPF